MGLFSKRQPDPVGDFLNEKYRACTTREGCQIVNRAIRLRVDYPNLSGPELLRLAYFGASGATT